MKLARWFKQTLLGTFWGLYTSGVLIWVFRGWIRVQGPLGMEPHPLETNFVRVHAIFAYVILLCLGYLIAVHVQPGLKKDKRKRSGLAFLAAFGVLVISALPILYAPDGMVRESASFAHIYLGLGVPLLLGLHLRSRKKRLGKRIKA